jgi:hypothetical protein
VDVTEISSIHLPPRVFNPLLAPSQPFEFSILKVSTFIIVFGVYPSNGMDITQKYATAAGGVFFIFTLVNLLPHITPLMGHISLFTSKHLTYPYLIYRHRFLGPWSPADGLVQLIYLTANVFCFSFRVATISEVGLRAGTLSLINMIPLFAGPHLSFLADLLGVSLRTYRQVHRSAGLMSFALILFNVLVVVFSRASFPLDLPQNLSGLIVRLSYSSCPSELTLRKAGSSLALLLLLSYPLFRKPSYELFLRLHQALAAVSVCTTWRHLPSDKLFPRFYVHLSVALFLSTSILQCGRVLYQNGIFYSGLPRAHITVAGGAIKIRVYVRKPLEVKAGQYVNLWMWIPSISFWSIIQSHPFVVTSWADGQQYALDLFIEPRRGLTRELFYHGQNRSATNSLVLLSGPHGSSAPIDEYQNDL